MLTLTPPTKVSISTHCIPALTNFTKMMVSVITFTPLALMMVDATEAETVEQRNTILQRIGDVALFSRILRR
jgi:hypothetical protein